MNERINLDRKARSQGSQPVIFESQTIDALAGMVLALLGEVTVMRDRLDANERLLAAAGLHGPADVDSFAPDLPARERRAEQRQASYDRVLGVARDRLMPQTLAEHDAYETIVSAVARD